MHDPPRILIVDDNETNRDILATRLRTHGYDLCQAADGEAALAAAETLLPDLILLDVMMPKLNGIEVCRRLKKDAALPFMAIILVTAKADSKDIVVGLDAGADEYLTKPVDQAALDWIDRRFNSGAGAMWFFTRSVDVTSSPGAGGGVLDDDAIGAAVVDQPPALFAVIVFAHVDGSRCPRSIGITVRIRRNPQRRLQGAEAQDSEQGRRGRFA
jgi:CheY-like chemotaxis protein